MRFRIISMALGLAATVAVATPALAQHNTASKANKFLSLFVRAYNACSTPSTTHNSPLAFAACTPSEVSTALKFGPRASGQAKGTVKVNTLKQATDVQLIAKFGDVRSGARRARLPRHAARRWHYPCHRPLLRGRRDPCTMIDIPFPIPLPCGTAASPPQGAGKCLAKTSANAVVPGAVVPGKNANVELGQLSVLNGSDIAFVEGLALK